MQVNNNKNNKSYLLLVLYISNPVIYSVMRNENTNQTKGATSMKFQAEEKFDFIYTSDTFKIVSDKDEMLVRWSYHNMYGFSACDKTTSGSGEKCNFNSIALEYQTECQGEMIWLSYQDYEPTVTKKEMMSLINSVNEDLTNDGHDFSGRVITDSYTIIWKIKESK